MPIRPALASVLCVATTTLMTVAGAPALADETTYGPEWQPGPDHTNFEPGPDYDSFQTEPDQSAFEPGYAPGTADLLDALTSSGFLGSLFGRR